MLCRYFLACAGDEEHPGENTLAEWPDGYSRMDSWKKAEFQRSLKRIRGGRDVRRKGRRGSAKDSGKATKLLLSWFLCFLMCVTGKKQTSCVTLTLPAPCPRGSHFAWWTGLISALHSSTHRPNPRWAILLSCPSKALQAVA